MKKKINTDRDFEIMKQTQNPKNQELAVPEGVPSLKRYSRGYTVCVCVTCHRVMSRETTHAV